jgi:flagellar L-ring protein FlgH
MKACITQPNSQNTCRKSLSLPKSNGCMQAPRRSSQILEPLARVFALSSALFLLAGCEVLNPRPPVDITHPTSARPVEVAPIIVNNGSIYQSNQYRPLFEDHRARLVGDTITVQIVENISASQSSTSKVDKAGGIKAGFSALPGISPNSFLNNRMQATGNMSNNFEGKGSTQSSNTFTGTITATVIEVLPNGHMVIAGEKQIGVNHSVDVLRFSGQIDPRTIQPGNVVPSAKIANVRVEQRGRGAQADAQGIGWLGRFFLSVLPL